MTDADRRLLGPDGRPLVEAAPPTLRPPWPHRVPATGAPCRVIALRPSGGFGVPTTLCAGCAFDYEQPWDFGDR